VVVRIAIKERNVNRIQRLFISIAVPVIVILVSFTIIGSGGSISGGDDAGITFNPFLYLALHGIEWSIVVILIVLFELFWWKDPRNKDK
jgi:uncharacterized BrkB/YihY/UPF0761 family membrane protein